MAIAALLTAAALLAPSSMALGSGRSDTVPPAAQMPELPGAPAAEPPVSVAPVALPDAALDPPDSTPWPRQAAGPEDAPPRPAAALAAAAGSPAPVGRGSRASPASSDAADEGSQAAAGEDEAAAASIPFDQLPPRDYSYDQIVIPEGGGTAPAAAKGRMARLLDRVLGRSRPAAPIARGPIGAKADFAARLEPLLPWRAMDKRRDRKLPDYGEAGRWRAYLAALRQPVPLADRVVVFRVTEPDSLLATESGLANLSYFLVKERAGRAKTEDLIAAARDIWTRLGGTANSVGLHTVDSPEEQRGTLRSSPWISTTRSIEAAPGFRPDPANRVEVLVLDPRLLFDTSGWSGEHERLTPFAIWPEDLAAAMPAKEFSPKVVRAALRGKYGPAAEALIAKTPGLR